MNARLNFGSSDAVSIHETKSKIALKFLVKIIPLVYFTLLFCTLSLALNPVEKSYYLKDGIPQLNMSFDTNIPNGTASMLAVTGGNSEVCRPVNWTLSQPYLEDKLFPEQHVIVTLYLDSNSAGGGSATLRNAFISEFNLTDNVRILATNTLPSCNFYGQPNGFACNYSMQIASSQYISSGNYLKIGADLCAKKVTANIRYNSTARNSNFTITEETAVPLAMLNWTFESQDTGVIQRGNDIILKNNVNYFVYLKETELGATNDTSRQIYLKYRRQSDSSWTQLPNSGDSIFGVSSSTSVNPSLAFSVVKGQNTSIGFNITPKTSGKWSFNATPSSSPISINSGQMQNFSVGKRLSFHYSSVPQFGINQIMNESFALGQNRSSQNSGAGTFYSTWVQYPPQSEAGYGGLNITKVRFTFYENSTNPSRVTYTPRLYKRNSTSLVLIGSCSGIASILSGLPTVQSCEFGLAVPYKIMNTENASLNATIEVSISNPGATYAISYAGSYDSYVFLETLLLSADSNTAPNISQLSIIPSIITSSSSLNCSAMANDNESSSLNILFTWYVNTTHTTLYDSYMPCTSGITCHTGILVPPSALKIGSNWTCSARSDDNVLFSNYSNSSTLAVQGSLPVVSVARISEGYDPQDVIDLIAGSVTNVYCNGTVYDADGYADISLVNGTFFHLSESFFGAEDNQTIHYSNSSCSMSQLDANTSSYSCLFSVSSHAKNGTWLCNVSAHDSVASNHSYMLTNISELLAINVTSLVDYGALASGETSGSDIEVNVSNIGNVMADINLYGFGQVSGDYYSLVCAYGSVPIINEHYDFVPLLQFSDMYSLTGNPSGTAHTDFNLPPQHNASASAKNIFWKIQLPAGLRGECTGTIVFSAIRS